MPLESEDASVADDCERDSMPIEAEAGELLPE